MLSLDTLTATGAGATAAQYTDVVGSVAARIAGVETGYIQFTNEATAISAALAEVFDMTAVTGMSTLWLDVVGVSTDAGAAGAETFAVVRNFGGATINLSEAGNVNPESLTLDGVGQALRKHTAQTHPFHLVVQAGVKRVDIDRQAAFAPQVVPGVFMARRDEGGIE